MNAPMRPPPPEGDPWFGLSKIAEAIERNVRRYQWLTLVNAIVFGTFMLFNLGLLVLSYLKSGGL